MSSYYIFTYVPQSDCIVLNEGLFSIKSYISKTSVDYYNVADNEYESIDEENYMLYFGKEYRIKLNADYLINKLAYEAYETNDEKEEIIDMLVKHIKIYIMLMLTIHKKIDIKIVYEDF